MDSGPSNYKRSREGSDILPEEMNKRIRTDIFIDLFDDDDDFDGERDAVSEDIASVIKSLKDEIGFSSSSSPLPVAVDKLRSTDLGYLLEASDDEIGMPPTTSGEAVESALVLDWDRDASYNIWRGGGECAGARLGDEDSRFGQIWGIEYEFPYGNEMGFDYYSEELFDFSNFSWRQGTLSAV